MSTPRSSTSCGGRRSNADRRSGTLLLARPERQATRCRAPSLDALSDTVPNGHVPISEPSRSTHSTSRRRTTSRFAPPTPQSSRMTMSASPSGSLAVSVNIACQRAAAVRKRGSPRSCSSKSQRSAAPYVKNACSHARSAEVADQSPPSRVSSDPVGGISSKYVRF